MKQLRSTSAQAAIEAAMMAAAPLPEPPPGYTLRPGDYVYWNQIIRARTRDEWSPFDLGIAVELARVQADIKRERDEVDKEGAIVYVLGRDLKAYPTENPRLRIIDKFVKHEYRYMFALKIVGMLGSKSIITTANRRLLQHEAESNLAKLKPSGAEPTDGHRRGDHTKRGSYEIADAGLLA